MKHTAATPSVWKPGIIFIAAMVIPGLILSIIAIRAAKHEEAFVEKQLQTTYAAELTQTVFSIQQLLGDIQKELDTTAPLMGNSEPGSSIAQWDSTVALVDVPYLFKRTGSFIQPDLKNPSAHERDFISFNTDFFMDRKSVAVLRSISDDYTSEILSTQAAPAPSQKRSRAELRNLAASTFEQDEAIQKKMYSDLQKKGKVIPLRNVVSGSKSAAKVEAYTPQLSSFVTESMRFSQIIATASSGLIPRVIDNRMMLIYWKIAGPGFIIGCSVAMDLFKERLVGQLPPLLSNNRFLTVLDHNGTSIIPETSFSPQNWNQPFTSREISRLLPQWEAAIYIVNPQEVTSRARTTALSLALLAALLFITIAGSGLLLLKSVHAEIRLARQKTTFVTNVSHELKTPLTSIRLFAELLKERRQKDPEKQEKYLSIMISETERLTKLINNVLDFSRMNRGKRTYSRTCCDVNELCREVTENQRIRLEHAHFTFSTDFCEAPLPLYADAEAIKQALLNVLSNAEKYASQQRCIRVSSAAEGSHAILRIADNGIGIDPSKTELIFREFYRIDDSLTTPVQGTGLGLAITRQIIRDHGGDISCQNNQPCGTEFVITLPLHMEEHDEPHNTRR